MVQSHLIRFGFVKDYMVWTFHGKKVDASGGASGGNSSTAIVVPVNADPIREPVSSSSAAAASNDYGVHDYITMKDLFQDMADDGGGGDGQEATMMKPKDVQLF
jgi:hypothetical protein